MKNKLRRCLALLMIPAIVLFCTACRNEADSLSSTAPSDAPPAVNRTEEVTIPEPVLEMLGMDLSAAARKLGLDTVTVNIDGSCTVHMTAEERDAVLASLYDSLEEEIAALPESGTWPFLDRVELSRDLTKVILYSEAARYDPIRDNTAAQAIYLPCLLYIAFSGGDAEAFTQQFTVLDKNSGTLGEFSYPVRETEVNVASPSPEPETE